MNIKTTKEVMIITLATTEEEMQEKRNKSIIDKIKAWQSFDYVKPLICRKTNQKLVPKVHRKSGKVILKAPKSNYVQWSIPNVVLNTRLVVFEHARHKRNPKTDQRQEENN